MAESIPCPDCGHPNAPGSASCEACNFPIVAESQVAAESSSPPPPERMRTEQGRTIRGPGPVSFNPLPPRPRPVKRSRATQSLPLWLMFGFMSAVAVVFIAIKANVDRVSPPVAGSNVDQQQMADQFRATLAADSTDLEARIGLANTLYDTGNWADAIGHYERGIGLDSTRVGAIVDLGVCYYNLGNAMEAERHFKLALARNPHQPVALFNLGIVSEGRENWEEALKYFHRAIETSPPEGMREPIVAAIARVAEKTGRAAKPLPDGK